MKIRFKIKVLITSINLVPIKGIISLNRIFSTPLEKIILQEEFRRKEKLKKNENF